MGSSRGGREVCWPEGRCCIFLKDRMLISISFILKTGMFKWYTFDQY